MAYQTLPGTFFGILPKSVIYLFMKPFMNNPGAKLVNSVKYLAGRKSKSYRQAQAAYHFLLDYVPNWERAYGQLVQYQSFIPRETAQEAWEEMLTLSLKNKIPAYLGVTKRHRADGFLLSHAVDGFSLAMDFKVTRRNREGLRRMLQDFDRIVLEAGGRFYFAKNSETSAESTLRFLGEEAVSKFLALKKRCGDFDAEFTIPADTPPGLYDGAITVDDGAHLSIVPATVNVAVPGDDLDHLSPAGRHRLLRRLPTGRGGRRRRAREQGRPRVCSHSRCRRGRAPRRR